MKDSWQNIVDMFTAPRAAFARLKSEPKWVLATIIFCLVFIGTTWVTIPFIESIHQQQMMAKGTPVDQFEMPKFINSFAVTLFTLAGLLAISATLTLAARWFLRTDDKIKFRHVYAAIVHASLIRSLIMLLNTALLVIFRDLEEIRNMTDLKMIPGVHLLVGSSENVSLLIFLSDFNLLSLWSLAVLTIGIHVFTDTDRTKAILGAIVIWFVSIVYAAEVGPPYDG